MKRTIDLSLLCPSRRVFLASAGTFVAWAAMPRMASAAVRDPRLVVVILRGAMDGLAVVPPVGDPDYPGLRGDLAIGTPGLEPTLALDGFFGLNQAMAKFHDSYTAGEALIVHAAATAYRDRSHFDGQDVLESGMTTPHASASGWLNRVAAALPVGDKVRPADGLAASATVPLILRGAAPILTWTPPGYRPADSDTIARLTDLYGESDPELARAFAEGLGVDKLAANDGMSAGGKPAQSARGLTASFVALAAGAGRLLADPEGPRLAAISYDGWDTHASEGAAEGHLANLLAAFDAALAGLQTAMAPVWSDTAVVVMTEFGRTARINGTEGTDHGTATAAFLMGGAVRGGRIIADWPGLKPAQLYQQRDLAATTDLRAVLKGVLRDHLGLSERTLATTVFPDSTAVRPLDGLIA
ncbi:MAG: DUF1501 domain-containing protein [Bauldia sp.]